MGNVTTKLIEAYAEVNINEKKKLDPVDAKALNKDDAADRKDGDIDNDGDVDKSDEYLHNRRKTVKKAMKDEDKKNEDVEEAYEGTMVCEDCGCEQENPNADCNCENDSQNLQASYWTPKESYLAAQKKNEGVEETTMDESQKAELAKKLAKASASSAKGRKLVSLKKAPWEKEKKEGSEENIVMNPSKDKKDKKDNKGEVDGGMAESVMPAVYARIIEARKNPEGEKAGSTASKGEADFVKSHTDNVQVDDTEAKGHDDVSKAGRAGPSTKARPSDNMKGDKKIMPSATPMKGK